MKININKNKFGSARSDKPSRFLIELKSEIEDLKEKEDEKEKQKEKGFLFKWFLKLYFWFKNIFKPKVKVFTLDSEQKKRFEGVLFYPLLKIAFKVSGIFIWFIHFALRFFYFSTKSLVENFKSFKKSVEKPVKENKKKNLSWGESVHVPEDKVLGSVIEKKGKTKKHDFKKTIKGFFSKREKPLFSIYYFKKVFYFSLLLIAISLPLKFLDSYNNLGIMDLKGRVLSASEDATSNLVDASKSASNLDFSSAQSDFTRASDDLLSVKIELEKINDGLFFLASLLPNQKIKLASEGKKITQAGILGSEIGDNFSRAIAGFSTGETLMESLEQFNSNIGLAKIILQI